MAESDETFGGASIADEVIEKIKRLIRERQLRRGARLPAERELADALGVSRPSLREALATLGYLGVLETRPGSGTRIAVDSPHLLRAPFEFLLLLTDTPATLTAEVDDLTSRRAELRELREVLEVRLAERAAERRTDTEINALTQAVEALRTHHDDPRIVADADMRFHASLAVAAKMPTMAKTLDGMRSGALAGDCAPVFAPGSWVTYADILTAVSRRSAVDAATAMRAHLRRQNEPSATPPDLLAAALPDVLPKDLRLLGSQLTL